MANPSLSDTVNLPFSLPLKHSCTLCLRATSENYVTLHELGIRAMPRETTDPDPHIAHLDMHHLVFGINFQIHSVSLTSLVSIHGHSPPHPLVNPSLSSSPQLSSSITTSLQAQNLPFQQILPTLDFFTYWTAFVIWDWTGPITLISLFLVSHFNFLFIPCGGLSWLPVSFLLYDKIRTIVYRIISYVPDETGQGQDSLTPRGHYTLFIFMTVACFEWFRMLSASVILSFHGNDYFLLPASVSTATTRNAILLVCA